MPLAQRGAFWTPAGTIETDDEAKRRGKTTRPKDEAKGRGQRTRPKDEAKGRGQRTRPKDEEGDPDALRVRARRQDGRERAVGRPRTGDGRGHRRRGSAAVRPVLRGGGRVPGRR